MNVEVPIDQIRSSPYQPRLTFHIEDLKQEIERDGLLSNLIVRKQDGFYEIIDGERRWRVLKELGWKKVSVEVRDVDDQVARRSVYKLNKMRENYTVEEEARYFKNLYDEGMKPYQIEIELGVPHHWVQACLNIWKFPKDIQENVFALHRGAMPYRIYMSDIRDLEGIINRNTNEAIAILRQIIKERMTADEKKALITKREKKIDEERLKKAGEALGKPEVKLPKTAEEYEEVAKALMKRAKELKTPEQKAEEKRQKLIAQARKSLNSAIKKIDSAEKIIDVDAFRKRLNDLEKSLEQNPADVREQLIALGKAVTEAKKQRQNEIKEEKRLKEQVEKARKVLSSISFEECDELGINIKPYKNEIAEIESYLGEKPTEAWNAADALKKRLEKEVNDVKIQKEAEKRAKELEEVERRRIAEVAEAKAREELLKDKEFIRTFIKKEYPLMHEALGTEDLEKLLMERLMASIPEKKKDRAKEIFREEFMSLRKRLKIFPEKSAKMEPKFEYLRLMEERGVIPYTIWDFRYRDDYAGDKDFHGNCSPQVIEQCIWRFSNEGELVLDPMAGSGTALDVCKKFNRRCIGYDIKPPEDRPDIIRNDSRKIPLEEKSVDMIFIHPPYWNLTYYTMAEEGLPDLSRAKTVEAYLATLKQVFKECYRVLKHGKFMCVLLGDLIRDGRFIPLCRKTTDIAEEIGFIDYGYAVKLAHGEVSRKKSGVITAEPFYTKNLKISHDPVMFFKKG